MGQRRGCAGGALGSQQAVTDPSDAKSGPLIARVTYLEMTARPRSRPPLPTGRAIALFRTEQMPPAFYRFLYEEVGRKHHWSLRRHIDDAALSAIIDAATTRIEVLYVDGCPAGFFEIDTSGLPQTCEIVYFGILPAYQGQKLSKWFLACAIEAAWHGGPQRVTLHTNSLDHPRALPLYQKMGFSPVGVGEEEVPAW